MATKERPILFSGSMVCAILEGRKTQTRRIIKNPINEMHTAGHPVKLFADWALSGLIEFDSGSGVVSFDVQCAVDDSRVCKTKCPYGVPGDRLWVRETFLPDPPRNGEWEDYGGDFKLSDIPAEYRNPKDVLYKADPKWTNDSTWKFKPSIHMPRWASRLALEIVSVRVERLQEISTADAIAEGITKLPDTGPLGGTVAYGIPGEVSAQHPVRAYWLLWESINGPGSWDANPFVWVVEFKKVEATNA